MANAVFFSNTAVQTALSGSISSGALAVTVDSTTGFPGSFPYVLALDYGTSAEELVSVTSAAGTTLTVTRAYGGTSAQSHSLGAVVRHVYDATEATAFRTHEAASAAVHGLTGTVVGTTDTQTLTSKTLTSPTITGGTQSSPSLTTPTIAGGALSGTFTGAPTFSGNVAYTGQTTFTGNAALTAVASAVTDLPLIAKGAASQTADLQEWRNSANTSLAAITAGGRLSISSTDTGVVSHILVNAPSGASTSANLLRLQNNASDRVTISTTGQVSVNKTGNTAGVPLSIIAETGQTASLITAQVATTGMFTVSADGSTMTSGGKALIDGNGIYTTYANNAKATYTPTWAGLGTATLSTNTGWYQKIGKMVMFHVKAVTSAAGSGSSNVTFTLPSTPETTTDQIWVMRYGENAIGYAITFAGTATNVVDRLRIQDGATVGQVKNLVGSFITTGINININGWYWEA